MLEIDCWKFVAEKWLMEIDPVMSKSWDSHETVMRLGRGVLEGVDTVAPASNEGVPTDVEVPHLNQEYRQQLEKHFVKKTIWKKINERWELPCSLQSGSSWQLCWWRAQQHWCSGTSSPSFQRTQSSCTLLCKLSRSLFLIHFFYLQEHSSFRVQEDCVCWQDGEVVHANQCCWARHQQSGQDDPDWRLQGNSHLSFLFLPKIFLT